MAARIADAIRWPRLCESRATLSTRTLKMPPRATSFRVRLGTLSRVRPFAFLICPALRSRDFAAPEFFSESCTFLFVSKRDELQVPQLVGNDVGDESVYGEWSRAAHNERREAGGIQQIDLITRRSELRAGRRHADELYCAETVGKVHGKHRHQQHCRHRQTNNGHEGAQNYCKATEQLGENSELRHEMWMRNAHRLENGSESAHSSGQLCEPVFYEAVPNDQPDWNGSPSGKWKSAR